ncbi:SixA phosphatase family protein [Saccharicrinis fermentans]|nr:histidine phosphatase family protein [Saccharicrinis fermentans]
MKNIILVRHAKTEALTDFDKSDFERELLPRGQKDSVLMAEQLKKKGIMPDLFITSSAKRAEQTAQIYAEQLGYPEDKIMKERFIYDGFTTAEMLRFLGQFDEQYNTIIIFGHNPDIAGFTVNLVDEDLYHFPTSCTTALHFSIKSWKDIEPHQGGLITYMYPKQFK